MNTKECTEILSNKQSLRQGDIFKFLKEDDDKLYGIVITGDCDIDKNKCKGIISYCNITTAKYYIQTEYLKGKLDLLLEFMKGYIVSQLQSLLKTKFLATTFINILNQSEDKWKNITDNPKLIDFLNFYKKKSKQLCITINDIIEARKLLDKKVEEEKQIENLKKDIHSHIKSLPGDKFFIGEIPNDNKNYGYIAHLRCINSINKSKLINTNVYSDKEIVRVCHLEAPFLYRLTQQVGAIFSDIGLPEYYEKSRDDISTLLEEELENE